MKSLSWLDSLDFLKNDHPQYSTFYIVFFVVVFKGDEDGEREPEEEEENEDEEEEECGFDVLAEAAVETDDEELIGLFDLSNEEPIPLHHLELDKVLG